MPRRAKRLFKRAFVGAGAVSAARLITGKRWAAVLMYHGVSREPLPVPDWCFVDQDRFLKQMAYLATFCEVVPLRELPARLAAGDARHPLVSITFDDGFRDNYTVAYPIMADLGLPSTIFLATDLIGTDRTVWFARLHAALMATDQPSLHYEDESGQAVYELHNAKARARASAFLQGRLKTLPPHAIDGRVDALVAQLGGDPAAPVPVDSPFRMLSVEQVRELATSGLVDFGGHTCSHSILSRLDPSEQRAEIAGCLRRVSELTGASCELFAYPNGRAHDYDEHSVDALRRVGVPLAVTTVERPVRRGDPPLELGRYGVGGSMDLDTFRLTVHHVRALLRRQR